MFNRNTIQQDDVDDDDDNNDDDDDDSGDAGSCDDDDNDDDYMLNADAQEWLSSGSSELHGSDCQYTYYW